MRYSHTSIIDWFSKVYGIASMPNQYEIKTNCPYCGHPSFFFNVRKAIGFCHHDVCHKKPTLTELIEKVGFAPDEYGVSIFEEEKEQYEIQVPGEVLVWREGKEYMTRWFDVVTYLRSRGLTDDDMIRFKATFDGSRVYIPVMEDGRIINYVGRDLTGELQPKYKYCHGQKTSKHIFGWDECKFWTDLTLVENTFVSIWLRNHINCTTNFGSHLSQTQIDLIENSAVQRVVLMWDEGAEGKAEQAVNDLGNRGIESIYVIMKGQPDDHPLEELIDIRAKALESLGKSKFVDPFGRFPNKKGIIN